MSFDLQKHDTLDVITVVWHADFSYQDEAPDYEQSLKAMLEPVSQPQTIILDSTQMKMSFNDIMFGIQRASQNETSVAKHPMVKQFIVISNSRAMQLSAAGLEKIGLRDLKVKVVGTMDDALEAVKQEQIAS